MNQWLFLSIAIISEVVATSALKSSAGFTQLWPSLLVIAGYAAACSSCRSRCKRCLSESPTPFGQV